MKPKEFTRGSVMVKYINKTWNKEDLNAKSFSLYIVVLFEIFVMINVLPNMVVSSTHTNRILLILCLTALTVCSIALTLIIGYSNVYGNKEKQIRFLEWLEKTEDIRVRVDDNKIFLLVKQGRVYQTYSIDSFLQPYTTKYKIVNRAYRRIKYIEFGFDFKNPTNTIVVLH